MGILRYGRKDDVDVASCLANLDRLEAVHRSGLMSPSATARLDGLISRAAERLGTPMAFVSVLDDHRLVLAGAFGLTGELAVTRETTPEASYCQYVVALDDVLVVNDSCADSLVADHPATTAGDVRSYLGVPIRQDGFCVGSFCVVDTRPREWSDEDLSGLTELGALALPPTLTTSQSYRSTDLRRESPS